MPRSAVTLAILTSCIATLLSACSGTHTIDAAPSKSMSPSQSPSTSSTAPTASTGSAASPLPTGAQLLAALPPLPAGAKPFPASTGPNGLLDAKGYVTAAMVPNAAQDLPIELRRGLQAGARWTWATSNGELVEIFMARFATDEGAESYYLMEHAAKTKEYAGVAPTVVPGVPTSFNLSITKLDDYGNANVRVHAVAGDTVVVVNVLSPATPDPSTANALTLQMAKQLCSDQGIQLH